MVVNLLVAAMMMGSPVDRAGRNVCLPQLGKQLDDVGSHILVVPHKQVATVVEADELRAGSPLAWHS